MTQERIEALQRKIQGLLAKASDANIPEAEQNTYRDHARKLMETYCIEYVSDARDKKAEILDVKFEPYAGLVIDNNLHKYLPYIMNAVAKYFGCSVILHRVGPGLRLENFVGFAPQIEMCQYATNVILRQGKEEYKRLYRLQRSITFGESFWQGFALGVERKFKPVPANQEKALVLYDQVGKYIEERTQGRKASMDIVPYNADFRKHGEHIGENVTLHKPVQSGKGGGFLG